MSFWFCWHNADLKDMEGDWLEVLNTMVTGQKACLTSSDYPSRMFGHFCFVFFLV